MEKKKNLQGNEIKKLDKKKTEYEIDTKKNDRKIIPPKASSENLWILSFALVGGVLISKYI